MNVLITGAAGFTAAHLAKRLRREKGITLVGTDTLSETPKTAGLDKYWPADVTDRQAVADLVRRTHPDRIFHLAGLAQGGAPDLYRVNLLGGVNLLEAVKAEVPEASVLLVGSAAEYGIWPPADMPLSEKHECRPVGPYGLSKYAMTLAAQDFARNAGLKVVVVRPFNLIGAGMPKALLAGAIIERARAALAHGESTVPVGNTEPQRDFLAIEDAADAYVRLLQAEQWGGVFNVCSGQPRSIQSIIDMLLSFSPKPLRVVEAPTLKRSIDAPIAVGDPTKARQVCGFTPRINLETALRSAWEHVMRP